MALCETNRGCPFSCTFCDWSLTKKVVEFPLERVHAELDWDDARPAYAIALAAHAVLCEVLDEDREQLLAAHWERIRGRSSLDWAQARPLVADGCRALNRLDPLAMHR